MLASMASTITAPVRPTSARRGRGRSVRDVQHFGVRQQHAMDTAVVHGSKRPPPDADSLVTGPGEFRDFAADAKFDLQDPLRQRLPDGGQYYDMGSERCRDTGRFDTCDFSLHNERLHNWRRNDTFQTPHGHASCSPERPSPRSLLFSGKLETSSHEENLQSVVTETVRSITDDLFSALRQQISDTLGGIHNELKEGMSSLSEEVAMTSNKIKTAFTTEVKAERELLARLASQVKQNNVATESALEQIRQKEREVDFSPMVKAIQTNLLEVLKAMEARHVEVDLSPILAAIQKNQVDLSPVLTAIRDSQVHLDVSPLLEAIDQARLDVDFSVVLNEIRELRQPIHEVGALLDLSPVINAIQEARLQTKASVEGVVCESMKGITMICERIQELSAKQEVSAKSMAAQLDCRSVEHVTAISKELADLKTDVLAKLATVQESATITVTASKDVSANLEATLARVTAADVQQIIDEIQQLRASVLPIVQSIERRDVDLSPLMKALDKNKSEVALLGQAVKAQSCYPEMIKEIRKVVRDIDFSAITGAIRESRRDVDFSKVLSAIREKTIEVDFDNVFRKIRETNAAWDLSTVLQSNPEIIARSMSLVLEEIRGHMSLVLKAIGEVKTGVEPMQNMMKVMEVLPAGQHVWTSGPNSDQYGEVLKKLWDTQQLMVRTGASHQEALQEVQRIQRIAHAPLAKSASGSRGIHSLCDTDVS